VGLNLNILLGNYPAYGYKTKDLQNLKQEDFVKIFGEVKTNIGNNEREHKNVRILSSQLLKAKEQVRSQDKDKKSILGQINSFRAEDKLKSYKKDHSKGAER
jgi:conserved domain protein